MKCFLVLAIALLGFGSIIFSNDTPAAIIEGHVVKSKLFSVDSVYISNPFPIYVNGEKLMPVNGGHTLSFKRKEGFKINGVICQVYKE